MIFYFSGTGNSLFVAKRLLNDDERLISIADAINNNEYRYIIDDDESVGFIFPVYFYTVPTIVRDFISKLSFNKTPVYTYGIITCGGSVAQAGSVLKKELNKRGIFLNYLNHVLMPDNSMLFYQIPGVDKADARLDNAEKVCVLLKEKIDRHEGMKIGNITIISTVIGAGYKACMNTAKFYATDKCISCGKCEKNCPEKVIRLTNGKPEWTKAKCTKCSACINCCPTSAIQYGKSTIKRNRYSNPRV